MNIRVASLVSELLVLLPFDEQTDKVPYTTPVKLHQCISKVAEADQVHLLY